MPLSTKSVSHGRLALAVGVALLAAGCGVPPAGPLDYRETHAIEPVPTRFVLATRFEPGSGRLAYADRDRLERFLRAFFSRGRSSMVIATTPDSAGLDAQENMAEFRRRLVFAGVRPQQIDVKPGIAPLGGDHSVVLSFRGYEISVPECGDWSGHAGYNPANLPHPDYGCSVQRNFGLMLADPGDLLTSEGESYVDAQRSDLMIGLYRAGEATGAELPISEAAFGR